MANGDDSFSMSIKQENPTVPPPPPPTTTTPPPRETDLADEKNQSLLNSLRSTSLTPQETETCLRSLTNVMTSSEDSDDALFQEVISKLSGSELQRMAALLTSKSDDRYFLEMARNKNGSIRLQKLLGKSDDADIFFVAAILRNFFHVMTDEHAPYVAIQGMRVFSREKKRAMRNKILTYAVPLGCDQYGSIALNAIIRDVSFLYCSVALFDVVASNARFLSYSRYGNIVVQHVLKHCSLHSTRNIGVSLRGHYVELSFTEGGRYIEEQILGRDETGVLVMTELLECGSDKLVRLATSEYGHFVVETALKVTRGVLFRGLVNKLKPFLPLLRTSPQSTTIAQILESLTS
uniref:PUM-HD domain-containing protein n=1 Tax=Brassica campestris TaxID=3711 RepID=M4CEC0_BRACM